MGGAPRTGARAMGALRLTFDGVCLRDARDGTSLGGRGGPLGFQVHIVYVQKYVYYVYYVYYV